MMKGLVLMKRLVEADGVEESAIDALTGMLKFYLDRGFSFGGSGQDKEEIGSILAKLKEDSLRHKKILEETRAIIGGSDDDF